MWRCHSEIVPWLFSVFRFPHASQRGVRRLVWSAEVAHVLCMCWVFECVRVSCSENHCELQLVITSTGRYAEMCIFIEVKFQLYSCTYSAGVMQWATDRQSPIYGFAQHIVNQISKIQTTCCYFGLKTELFGLVYPTTACVLLSLFKSVISLWSSDRSYMSRLYINITVIWFYGIHFAYIMNNRTLLVILCCLNQCILICYWLKRTTLPNNL